MERYGISGYGTVRDLARQIGEREVVTLLSHTLGEEERADYLLIDVARQIIQQVTLEDLEEQPQPRQP